MYGYDSRCHPFLEHGQPALRRNAIAPGGTGRESRSTGSGMGRPLRSHVELDRGRWHLFAPVVGRRTAGKRSRNNDTFVGEVDGNDQRLPGSIRTRNTNALLTGVEPDPAHIEFFWRTHRQGAPRPVVVPREAGKTDDWFWPQDRVVVGGYLYLYLYLYSLRLTTNDDPVFNFAVDGVSLLVGRVNAVPAFSRYRQTETPLYLPKAGSRGEITYGMAVFPNTEGSIGSSVVKRWV